MWLVEVDVRKERVKGFSINKRYEIVCHIKGIWIFEIRAYSLTTGQEVPFKVNGGSSGFRQVEGSELGV